MSNLVRPSNAANIFLQLVAQHCCFASCKALLPVLPPRKQLVAQQISVLQVAATCYTK